MTPKKSKNLSHNYICLFKILPSITLSPAFTFPKGLWLSYSSPPPSLEKCVPSRSPVLSRNIQSSLNYFALRLLQHTTSTINTRFGNWLCIILYLNVTILYLMIESTILIRQSSIWMRECYILIMKSSESSVGMRQFFNWIRQYTIG